MAYVWSTAKFYDETVLEAKCRDLEKIDPDVCTAYLRAVHRSRANTILFHAALPDGIDKAALFDVLVTSRRVNIARGKRVEHRVLCDALEDPNCAIETLAVSMRHVNAIAAFGPVFEANTSLRSVDLSHASGGVQHITRSVTIGHIDAWRIYDAPPGTIESLLRMPSLLSITDWSTDTVPSAVKLLWPTCCSGWWQDATVARHPEVVPFLHRRLIYALYECLEGVLPDCVIEDIGRAIVWQNNISSV